MGASVLGNGVVLTELSGRRQNSAADLLQRAVTTTGLHRQAPLPCGERVLRLLRLPASLLTIAFTGQGLFYAEFLAWLQIE